MGTAHPCKWKYPELGNNDLSRALELNYQNPEKWTAEIELNAVEELELNYRYILFNELTGKNDIEWGDDRNLVLNTTNTDHYFCYDTWNSASSIDNVFLSTPFQDVLFRNNTAETCKAINPIKKYSHIFKVKMPLIRKDEALCIIGDCEVLGNWGTNNPIILCKTDDNHWVAKVDLSKVKNEVHYKYGICDAESKQFRYFESGPDHIAPIHNSKKTIIQLADGFVNIADNSWKKPERIIRAG